MAVAVWAIGRQLGDIAPWQRLTAEVVAGAVAYIGLLSVVSRSTLVEVAGLVVRRRAKAPAGAAA
jgi:hypothetical protein